VHVLPAPNRAHVPANRNRGLSLGDREGKRHRRHTSHGSLGCQPDKHGRKFGSRCPQFSR
jgi:hypothetical protein